jgi:hypothetical protein
VDQPVGGGHVGSDQGVQALDRRNAGICPSAIPVFSNVCRPTHWRKDTGPQDARQAAPGGDRKARFDYKGAMRAVLRTTDPVILDFAANVLSQEGIESVVFDTHASVMDGSMGFLPRRLMVLDEDFVRAEKLLRAAVPEAM